jgi:hypothetical protein
MYHAAGAVRKNTLTAKADDQAVETEIKEWLKFAPKRLKQLTERRSRQLERLERHQTQSVCGRVDARAKQETRK